MIVVLNKRLFLSAEVALTSPAEELTAADQTDRVLVVDLMEYTPLGGVFYFDVFHLPPQAHRVNEWEIRQVKELKSVPLSSSNSSCF